MIINPANTQPSASLFPSASARAHKHKASATGETDAPGQAGSIGDQAEIISQNMASTISPLQDSAAANTALQAIKKQFLAQPNLAMLAQANQLPQNALRLLQ